jgi:LruC domain-containing protein
VSYSPGEIGDLSSKDTKWKFKENDMIGDYSLGQVKNFTVYADCKTSAKEVGTALVTFANPCADEAVDSDNDGVLDDYDIAPNDANVASATYLPAYDKYATYAFEDLWPYKGDYDFNDLVVSHNATVMMNGEKMVTKVKYDLIIRAIGARFNNDLSLSFTDPQRSMTVANITPANVKYEVIAVDDLSEISLLRVKELFNSSDLINTDESQPFKEPIQVSIELTFDGSISASNFKVDEYLRINQEPGRELHKPGQPYTSLIDLNMLGDGDDDTKAGINKYYKTTDNLPWVLEIPTEWEYPREGTDITKAYPKFKAFAQGDSQEAWYTEGNGNKVAEHIYKR